jgi:pimeloyl-ACP methyl ester carboxylesterase
VAAEPFEVVFGDGALRGHRDGTGGVPALLLHGGPALPDYTGGCAALHVAVTYPDRVVGLLLVDTLGAGADVFPEFDANLRRGLTDAERARVDDIVARRRAGAVTEAELVERLGVLWPRYFGRPENAPPSPFSTVGAQASIDTNRSIAEHFAAGTLTRGLPAVTSPAFFVHGEHDPLPVRSSESAAALIPGARLETIPDCGHFPWLEQPAAFRETVERLLADTAL